MGFQPADDKNKEIELVTSSQDLLKYFRGGCKNADEVSIGMEVEKFGIHKEDHRPITYLENNGLKKIQEKLKEELNWEYEIQEEKFISSMKRGGSRLTLEYSESMFELSGRTHPSIHDLARELRIHQHELSEISRVFNVEWMGIGYQPFKTPDQFRMLKRHRFIAFDEYFKRKRSKAYREHWPRVAAIQANIDYTSEADARRKFQILLRLKPFLSAMYAHSPIKEGKNTGYVSYRTHVLRDIDPRRFGIRKSFFGKEFNFEKWIEFCLRIPMVTIYREGKWIPVKNMTFNQFIKSGYKGYAATMEDWVIHLSFIYTDVRIKQYIELRICDSLPPFLIPSMQAIVKAFVYHKDGSEALKHLTKNWSFRDFALSYEAIAKDGMQAEVKGKKLLDSCKEILNIATEYLRSFEVLNEKKEDESIHLQSIKEFVFVKEKSPGRWVMENWDGEWKQNPQRLIEWCSFENISSAGH